ncbi:MAG: hypothetical protein ACJ0UT_02650 [Candidatus Latescibacterota bacterium]
MATFRIGQTICLPTRDECTVATDRTDIKWDEDDHCEVYLVLDRISGASRVAQYPPFLRARLYVGTRNFTDFARTRTGRAPHTAPLTNGAWA